jgi:hypothetical protein
VGIFDEEARKMNHEATQQARSDFEEASELNRVARELSEELLAYLAKSSQAEGLDIGIHGSVVRVATRHRILEIKCEGPEVFHLIDYNNGFQAAPAMPQLPPSITTRVPISRRDMARQVLRWLRAHRGAGTNHGPYVLSPLKSKPFRLNLFGLVVVLGYALDSTFASRARYPAPCAAALRKAARESGNGSPRSEKRSRARKKPVSRNPSAISSALGGASRDASPRRNGGSGSRRSRQAAPASALTARPDLGET